MSVSKRKLVWLLLIILLLIASVYGLYKSTHRIPVLQNENTNQELKVIKPVLQDVKTIHNYIGQVEAINRTEIVPYINGYITDITAQGGQEVKKGDVLAVLKQDTYIADLAAADAAVFALKADYFNAKIKYERMKNSGENVYSQQELDNAKADFLSAAGNLEKARAEQFAAQTNFDYTYMKAPFDGVLGNVSASLGEYISPQSKNLMELVQYDPIRVVFSLTDKEFLNNFDKKKEQLPIVKIRLANGEIIPQSGKIKYTANSMDKNTNSLAVYTEFANPDNRLMPNAYVEVLLERNYKNAILIAKTLVIMQADGDYVYSVLNGVLNLHKLQILGEVNDKFAVADNFAKDEYLVTEMPEGYLAGKKVLYTIINQTE